MRRPALYSSSSRPPADSAAAGAAPPAVMPDASGAAAAGSSRWRRLKQKLALNNVAMLWSVVALLALLLAVTQWTSLRPGAHKLTQDDINAAVLKTLETTVLP
ncbi:MAG: peptidase, partial [Polaromonas sp.]|nr:peptidase [Polaromonas sp.]